MQISRLEKLPPLVVIIVTNITFSFLELGWSYGFKGNLVKAPRFDSVPEEDFDKSQYSLYKLHLHIDQLGFVWVNLDASEKPSISWEEHFKDIDTQDRIVKHFNLHEYVFDHTWSLDNCNFNWKTLVENYNEVSHRMPSLPIVMEVPNHE